MFDEAENIVVSSLFLLTLSQTSPGFYVIAV